MRPGEISFWDFQIEHHIRSMEHNLKLLKQDAEGNSVAQLLAGFLEKDLNTFKETVAKRKEPVHV